MEPAKKHAPKLTPQTVRCWHWTIWVMIDIIGPFTGMAITPWLPIVAQELKISNADAMLLQQACIYAKALGQLSLGAMSDRYGRRRVILITFSIYTVSLVAESFVWALWPFLLLRFVDGFCEATALIPVAIARDVWTDEKERSGALALIIGLRPLALMAAPAIGGVLGAFIGWRGLFLFQAALSLCTLVAICFLMPETLDPATAVTSANSSFAGGIKELLSSRLYVGLTGFLVTQFVLIVSVGMVASFIMEDYYSMEPWQAGLVQIIPAATGVLGAILYKVWIACFPRFDIITSLRWFLVPHMLTAGAMVLVAVLPLYQYGWGVFMSVFAFFTMMSILQGPPARSLRTQPFPHLAGLAIGFGGALEQLIPVSLSFLVTFSYDGTPYWTLLIMAAAMTVGAVFFVLVLGVSGPAPGLSKGAADNDLGTSLQPGAADGGPNKAKVVS